MSAILDEVATERPEGPSDADLPQVWGSSVSTKRELVPAISEVCAKFCRVRAVDANTLTSNLQHRSTVCCQFVFVT